MAYDASQELITIAQLRSWLGAVGSTADLVLDQQMERQQAAVRKAVASRCKQQHAELQWDSKLRAAEASVQTTMELLRGWTGCDTLPEMMVLLTDVGVRTDLAEEAFRGWRTAVAQFEAAQLLELPDELAAATAAVDAQHTRYMVYANIALTLLPQREEAEPA